MGRADGGGMRSSAKARMTTFKPFVLSAFLAMPLMAHALETVQYSRVFSARHLAGVAMDWSGATIANVKVEICKAHWADCFVSTMTKVGGEFSFPSERGAAIYYLRLSCPGFDPLEVKVRLRTFAPKQLKLRMNVAT